MVAADCGPCRGGGDGRAVRLPDGRSLRSLRLLAEEHRVYAEAIKIECGGMQGVACSGCKYCVPCPYGVDIPRIFHFWNMRIKWSGLPEANDRPARRKFLENYYAAFPALRNASRCIGCGECAKRCPQWQFTIKDELAKIDAYFRGIERENPDLAPPVDESVFAEGETFP